MEVNINNMSHSLISVTEAKALLAQLPVTPHTVAKPLATTAGCILAEDLFAPVDIPAFNQSSMDGYAFAFTDYTTHNTLEIVAKIPAGSSTPFTLQPGQAARVFTGAPIPAGADTVVMQEVTQEQNGQLSYHQPALKQGDNFRHAGSDISKGQLALPKGTRITPATIGFLAGMGFHQVTVYSQPVVTLLVTGDELQTPGQPLAWGQVYEASSVMIQALLAEMGISVTVHHVADDLTATTAALAAALQPSDIVLLTGGVSVGEFDYVVRAAENCGVQQLFHRVLQRPGKPLYAGVKEGKAILGLPGNPSSVLTCFYQYVWPLLRRYTGHNDQLQKIQAPLAATHNKPHPLTHFLKGIYANGKVTILTAQESYRMRSFAVANCLVELPAEARTFSENEITDLYLLPHYG